MLRNTRSDVVRAAGRMFAERGYHGTSMRELGRELGLLGSSLYAHIDSKEDLLVEVVDRGAALFTEAAERALAAADTASGRLRALIAGHIDVILEHRDVVRTFLNEARMLDDAHRLRVVAARDGYEAQFRSVIAAGVDSGEFKTGADPKLASIFTLSVLNAVERWYRTEGELDRSALVDELYRFVVAALIA